MIDNQQQEHDLQVITDLRHQTKNFRLLAIFVLTLIVFSAWFYHIVEKWDWIDSFYYIVVTIGTVGYGDFTPTTDIGKIYAMGLIIVGIATFGFFAQQLLKRQQLRTLQRQIKRSKTKDSEA